MKAPLNVLRTVLLGTVVFAPCAVRGEDSLRMVVIETAPKDALAIRAELGDAAKGAKAEAIDAVLKRKGITVLGDFKESGPWGGRPVEMSKRSGALEVDGEELQELGVTATLDGTRFDGKVTDVLQVEIATAAGNKAYRSRQTVGNVLTPASGRWQERVCWGDGRRTLMLWQHAVIEPSAEPPKENAKDDGRWEGMRLQMLWFQAAPADVEKVLAAKPETRDKAMEFLNTKAKLWKECSLWNRSGERTAWQDIESKMEIKNGEAVAEETGVQLDGSYSGKGDDLKMEWNVQLRVKSELAAAEKLAGPVTPGQWMFFPVKNWPGVSLVACRMVKE